MKNRSKSLILLRRRRKLLGSMKFNNFQIPKSLSLSLSLFDAVWILSVFFLNRFFFVFFSFFILSPLCENVYSPSNDLNEFFLSNSNLNSKLSINVSFFLSFFLCLFIKPFF
ncbi:hypothetical protein SSS_09747 [Sarcoptes scabiei]|nr:hypothetical protein SSS_09747 [Sarcoptes scabiei]